MRRTLQAIGPGLVAYLATACSVPGLELNDFPCPCAEGWVCDEAADVCVAVAASCEDAADGTACAGGTCRAGTCCSGCWDGDSCEEGGDELSCGRGGAACEACDCADDVCEDGACTPPDPVVSLGVGGDHTCAVLEGGDLLCWGRNDEGQLGLRDTAAHDGPEQVTADAEPDQPWSVVRANQHGTCALARNESRWCWGLNASGSLGLGDSDQRLEPAPAGEQTVTATALGLFHGCEVGSTRELRCWGRDDWGQVGITGTGADQLSPVETSAGGSWLAVTASNQTCAIRVDQSLWCWGYGVDGELGVGDFEGRDAPSQVGERTDWAEVSAGGYHSCGRTDGGELWCWGGDVNGQLGNGQIGPGHDEPDPVQIGPKIGWTRVAAGLEHTCALRGAGELWCWGTNEMGELGLGAADSQKEPVRIGTAADWIDISAGASHTCGVRRGGGLWCWGDDGFGQLGSGAASPAPPTRTCLSR